MHEPLYETIHLEMTERQRSAYDTINKEVLAFVDRESTSDPIFVSNALQKMNLLQRCAVSPTTVDIAGPSVKYDYVKDWLNDYPNEPVIVFTHNKAACVELASMIEDALPITGDVSNVQRDKTLALFKEGRVKRLVLVTDLAAESLSLSWVSKAVFLDVHTSSRLMSQAEMRIRRADSLKRAQIYYLLCVNSIDTLMYRKYKDKMSDRELVEEFLRRYRDARNTH
jgi:superfamily II DNA/RNA helicase